MTESHEPSSRPEPSHDLLVDPVLAAALAARFRASYHALPPVDRETIDRQIARMHASVAATPRRGAWHPRWWWGAAAAAGLVITVMRPWRPEATTQDAARAVAAVRPLAPTGSVREVDGRVEFALQLPTEARQVALVGDFNGWDAAATPMQGHGDARWAVQLPLPPGRHVYAFVVDGQRWIVDPLAPQVPDAEFGPTNAVIVDGLR